MIPTNNTGRRSMSNAPQIAAISLISTTPIATDRKVPPKAPKGWLNILFATSLFVGGITDTAFGEPLHKDFEFGAGTGLTSSKRTFRVPCHAGIEGVTAT